MQAKHTGRRGFGTEKVRRLMPPYYYDKAEVELMLQLDNRGFTPEQIAEALWYELPQLYDPTHWRSSKARVKKRVLNILADRELWHPHEDESLIRRAYDGDKDAYDSLNFYELRTLSDMLYEKVNKGESLTVWGELVDESSYSLSTRFSTRRRREEGGPARPIRRKTTEEQKKAILEAYYSSDKPNVTAIGREHGVSRETVYRVLGRQH